MAENTITTSHTPTRREEGAVATTRERTRYITPAVDIYETSDGLVVVADLPGVKRDDLEISVENDLLTIHGRPSYTDRADVALREFTMGEYYRQFTLSDRVDREKIGARLERGVLTLTLPRADHAKPRLIKVKSS
jgi:HSP20 family molecular chaperone IbpA